MKYRLILTFLTIISVYAYGQNAIKGAWNNVRIGGGGFVSGIITTHSEKDLVYARTDVGGAYRWNAEGQEWIPLLDWVSEEEKALLGVESMAIDPNAPNRLYIAAGLSGYNWPGASVLISNDYGETFDKIPMNIFIHGNGMGRQTGEKLVVDPNLGNIIYFGTREDGLLMSEDSARTWSSVESFPVTSTPNQNGISFVAIDPNSSDLGNASQTIYIGCSRSTDNLFVSKNGGETWTQVEGAPESNGIMPQRAKLSSDGKNLYVTYANGAGPHAQNWDGVDEPMNRGAVFKLDTETGEWSNISPIDFLVSPSMNGCYAGISIDAANSDRIVCSTINHWNFQQQYVDGSSAYGDRLFLSEDGGETWSPLFEGDNAVKLNNNGINWISGHSLHWVGSIEFDPFESNRIWATSGNGVFMADDISFEEPSLNFTVKGFEETVPMDMISIPNGPFISIVLDYDGWIHSDVTQFPTEGRHSPNMGSSSSVAYAYQDKNVLVRAGSSNGIIYYSLDQGQNWNKIENLPESLSNGKVAISKDGDTYLLAWIPGDTDDRFYITSNWGESWSNVWNSSYGSLQNSHPVSDPDDPRIFHVYSSQKGKVFRVTYPEQGRPDVVELASPGSGGSPHIAVNPNKGKDFWVAVGSAGLMHFDGDNTETYDNIIAKAVGIGKSAENADYATLFVWGSLNNIEGLYRSTDKGSSWFRINDDDHEYGGLGNAGMIIGDNNVFGRVYMSTAGRGFAYGDSGTDTLYVDNGGGDEDPDPEDPEDPDGNITGSIDENSSNDQFVAYPNPFYDHFQFKNVRNQNVKVYNLQGQIIEDVVVNSNQRLGGQWDKGIYILELIHNKKRHHFKIIKL